MTKNMFLEGSVDLIWPKKVLSFSAPAHVPLALARLLKHHSSKHVHLYSLVLFRLIQHFPFYCECTA